MLALGDASSAAGEAACFDGVAHGSGHGFWVLAAVDRASEKHAGAAELHGEGGVGGGADAGVDKHGHMCAGADELEVVWVEDAQARADGSAERHDGRGTGVL